MPGTADESANGVGRVGLFRLPARYRSPGERSRKAARQGRRVVLTATYVRIGLVDDGESSIELLDRTAYGNRGRPMVPRGSFAVPNRAEPSVRDDQGTARSSPVPHRSESSRVTPPAPRSSLRSKASGEADLPLVARCMTELTGEAVAGQCSTDLIVRRAGSDMTGDPKCLHISRRKSTFRSEVAGRRCALPCTSPRHPVAPSPWSRLLRATRLATPGRGPHARVRHLDSIGSVPLPAGKPEPPALSPATPPRYNFAPSGVRACQFARTRGALE